VEYSASIFLVFSPGGGQYLQYSVESFTAFRTIGMGCYQARNLHVKKCILPGEAKKRTGERGEF
jgi:hypothetical protein